MDRRTRKTCKREVGLLMSDLIRRMNGKKSKRGLWDNIRAKKARGEKMKSPGTKGAPTDKAIKDSQS